MKAYKNHSIFQGIAQYFDENGVEWRIDKGDFTYSFYEKWDDDFEYQGSIIPSNKKKSIKSLHNDFLDHLEKLYQKAESQN